MLFTDDRDADWAGAARALPRGSLVVVRAREARARAQVAESLKAIAPLLIAGDGALAARVGAAGIHLPQARAREAMAWRVRRPDWIITAAAHSLRALMGLREVDAVFLSPIFPTASHPGARCLSPVRAGFIAAAATVPVYALGGVTARNAMRLPVSFSGVAGIEGFFV